MRVGRLPGQVSIQIFHNGLLPSPLLDLTESHNKKGKLIISDTISRAFIHPQIKMSDNYTGNVDMKYAF